MQYLDNLINLCHRAKQATPIKEFILNDANDLNSLTTIQTAIYIIEEIDGDIEKTFNALEQYKANKERKCPKLNTPSRILYVGSSTTDLRKRIEQHIGLGHKDTYALHLKFWFHGKYIITIRQYDEPPEVVQLIEDAISHKLKPAFGKKGSNNK